METIYGYEYIVNVIDRLSNRTVAQHKKEFNGDEKLYEEYLAKWRKIAAADKETYQLFIREGENWHRLELVEEYDEVVIVRSLCKDPE